ncbi:TIM-barrel domain-containing protein [Amycolatopsis sp. CA-230715]|uniref:TIM-barrel domain-containing protein n=1 Tax=Amycolatopsis sp. CA-230715 TaxID=2745196 RepID=UPI001C0219E8|nr:TIM-barrel domain-containing protein [Amycolatopsis sp. CA-230715]QWF83813.1 hypothetical protein HUW46_07256 [Amycolatopsis sp. CA-230715]
MRLTSRRLRTGLRATTLGVLGVLTAAALAPAAQAATPATGTLSLDGDHTVTWQSPHYDKANTPKPQECAKPDPDNKVCDRFDLTVDVPASYWADNPNGGVPISIAWANKANDFDLYVYDSAGKKVAESAGAGNVEATVIPNASGLYHVVVVPYSVTNDAYTGKVDLPQPTDIGAVTGFSRTEGTYDVAAGAAKVKVDFVADDRFRLRVAPDGVFTDPAGSEIVRTTPPTIKNTRSWDAGEYYAIASAKLVLRVYKQPMRFALYRTDNRTVVWREDKGLRWTEQGMRQSLARGANEQFFGAGEQNGSFSHRDHVVNVANNTNWDEGGYPNSQPFYVSSAGYGVFRNTFAPGVYNFGDPVRTGQQEKRLDAYYFTGDVKSVIGQYTSLVGKPFMPPVYGLEPGDSDCYLHNANRGERHTLDSLKIAKGYADNQMPLGWMLVNDGYGCGYENLQQTGDGLRQYNAQLGLWTENGLPNQNEEVKAGVRVRKLDVAWVGGGYQFALNGCDQAKAGIEQNSDARGFVWLPVSWAGAQRCGVLWSGDQKLTWDYLRWQIPTYAGATMSGIAYNTGDVGSIYGHDPKMYARDLQWKAFLPAIMTMDGWAPKDQQPWVDGEPYTSINRKYLQLKERLLPYMYTLAEQAHRDGVGPVRPLALEYPDDPVTATDAAKYEFLLGKDFLVAPVYSDTETRDGIYLPKGTWVDYWTQKTYQGPTTINGYHAPLDTLPLFTRAGAVVPMWPKGTLSWQNRDKSELDYDVYAQGNSDYTLYEDDGVTRDFAKNASATQRVEVRTLGTGHGITTVSVGASTGNYQGKVGSRSYQFTVHAGAAPGIVLSGGTVLKRQSTQEGYDRAATGWFVDAKGVTHVKTAKQSTDRGFDVRLVGAGAIAGR